MRRFWLLMVCASALLAGCDRGTTTPAGPAVVEVEVLEAGVPVTELTLQVDERTQLSAAPEDASGTLLTDRAVQWRSSAPAVASVDTSGLVRARQPGTAVVTAQVEGVEDEVTVTVVPVAPLADVGCAAGATPLQPAVGEVLTTDARTAQVLCLGGGAGAEYALIPFNASTVASALRLELNGVGLAELSAAEAPAAATALLRSAAQAADGADVGFHARLRERERRELPARLLAGGVAGAAPGAAPLRSRMADPPAVGERMRLNVNTAESCAEPDYRTGRVEAVTRHAVIVADTANPEGGFTRAEFEELGATFDALIWPTNTRAFGAPADIDDNQRVVVFFTRAVNELTPRRAGQLTQGFFFARDLFPVTATERLGACEGSNEAELFYLLVPDPQGQVNDNVRTKDFVRRNTVGVLAHELQHLISASRRLHVLETSAFLEEVWLNEGLSHVAEELVFYATTALQPHQNLDPDRLSAAGAVPAFFEFQSQNFGRLRLFLSNPEAETLMGRDELPTRGASWAFLRYAADRGPSPDDAFWYDLVNSSRTGLANLGDVLGERPFGWMQDWTVSVLTDDLDIGAAARFQQPSWNFRATMAALLPSGSYPLRVRSLASGAASQATAQLKQGGAAYFRLVLDADRAAVRTTVGGVPAPSTLRLSLVRIR